jgi:peptidoglycan/xylan/chitin deacetylase (PgdA/CDA1 family)
MRRRRSRLPLIVLGIAAVILGATLAMAISNVRPSSDLLAWLGGQAAGTASPGPSEGGIDGATATDGTDPSDAGSASAAPSASDGGPAGTAGPGGSVAGSSAEPSGATASTPATGAPAPSATPDRSAPPVIGVSSTQAKPVYNGSRSKKVVALTFDDGYNPDALREILAILKREHITATFFPYGWAVSKDPAGWHMVAAAGYPIGNHTLRHTILTTVSPDKVYEEMTRGRRTIDLYSGTTSINLMRPPGGAFNAPVAREIKKAGYDLIVLWDVDTFDWQGPSADTIYQRAIKGTNGSIVLMHSGPVNTPKALPRIIANYRARGFTFVTVPELLGAG